MDYSKTVNLPRTDFPMKANLPQREPDFQKLWEEKRIYEQILERAPRKGDFLLHDGPPYSNGDIHMDHALNKLLKDFVVRYKAMSGFRTPFVPGWDNHGLPIEHKVSLEFRKKHESPSRLEIRRACREDAAKWVDIQRKQFKRLGITGDWDNPYLTMSKEYESAIVKVFGELATQGYVFRGLKPIHWCIHDETALAEAEIEYAEHVSPSIYVRFPLVADPNGLFEARAGSDIPPERCYTIIWTTTPWTIPANLAVAVHPDYEYSFVDVDGARYLIAAELMVRTLQTIGAGDHRVIKTVKGSELEGMIFKHPIFERDSVLVHASYVTLDEGTGVVHTAPGHGREDFETGQKYGLPALNPVDERGVFTKDAQQFAGMHIERQGNSAVIEALKESGNLLSASDVSHSYPHCWRCHHPVVFRATVQWFLGLDHDELRRRIVEAIDHIDCYPAEGKNRLRAMMETSPDWCLSRQRSWGVGIPVFFCKSCGEPLMSGDSIRKVYEDALANGSDSWYERDAAALLGPGFACQCGGTEFVKETDVLDVWFDSGSSSRAVTEQRHGTFQADMYLEGSDQHRGWFNKSIVVGMATKNASPFKELVTHGFVLDSEGKKMSKSGGNAIAPEQVVKDLGADVLRLYISSLDYFEDVRFGAEMFTRATDAYRRIRNTFRFILGNVSDFDPASDAVDYAEMEELDKFALHRLNELVGQIERAYDSYEFHKVYHAVYNYCTGDLSSFYLDVLKDRLYTSRADSRERRSAQTALYEIAHALARMLAPILAHTAEEVWQYLPGGKEESVHLASFPEARRDRMDDELAGRWTRLLEVRDKVQLALEEARQSGRIGKPMESLVILRAPGKLYGFLKDCADMLPCVFIVSQVELIESDAEELSVEALPPKGEKCDRCWLVLESVGNSTEHPTLCDRCVSAIT